MTHKISWLLVAERVLQMADKTDLVKQHDDMGSLHTTILPKIYYSVHLESRLSSAQYSSHIQKAFCHHLDIGLKQYRRENLFNAIHTMMHSNYNHNGMETQKYQVVQAIFMTKQKWKYYYCTCRNP